MDISPTTISNYLDEAALAGMTLSEILDPARRFDVLRLCQGVEQFGDPIRGAKFAGIFAKHIESNAVAQLSPKDRDVFEELNAWALFSGLEVQPQEVAADLFSKHALLLLQDGVNVIARVKHTFRVWGEMDGEIVFRTFFLQSLLRNSELLGDEDLSVPGEAPVRPTVKAWIEAYQRAVRREERTNIDRTRFLMSNPSAIALTNTQRKVLLSLLEVADELTKKPVSLGILRVPGEEEIEETELPQGLVDQYVGQPFRQQELKQAQEMIQAKARERGVELNTLLSEALREGRSMDVLAIIFLLARSQRLAALLHEARFRELFTSVLGDISDPRVLLRQIISQAVPEEIESAQLGAQLASLLVAQGERDYLGMVVFSQASGKYEWRV